MDPFVWDWIAMIVRWVHLITGIAWIGSSFYFIFLDASLRKAPAQPEGVAGETWQVHGGGFYRMRKYMVAPAEMPEELHWFKYEAYFTWISGFLLLALVYYLGAEVYLIDRSVMALPAWGATAIGAGSLAAGWLVYDRLCKSPIGENDGRLAALGFVLLIAASWGYTQVFSGRGAYVHAGALIGTIMVANVFFIIIPNQKKVVADLVAGRPPDPVLGIQAKQRSLHNNYLTLPVLFVMISNHYPMTFGSDWNWLVLAGIIVVGGVVRHFYNVKNQGGGTQWWLVPVAAVFLGLAIFVSIDRSAVVVEAGGSVGFAEVKPIFDQRCSPCHARQPTFEGFDAPPGGVTFETAQEIQAKVEKIHAQAVATDTMPPGNLTEMTEQERRSLAAWIAAGAPVE